MRIFPKKKVAIDTTCFQIGNIEYLGFKRILILYYRETAFHFHTLRESYFGLKVSVR